MTDFPMLSPVKSEEKPLKAYTVHDGDDGWCIVFAKYGVVARRFGANELDIEFDKVDFCRRTKWADGYAPGPIPKLVMIENGWWMECRGCDARIDQDREVEDEDGDFRKLEPVEVNGEIYCCEACRQRHLAEIAQRREAEGAAIKDLTSKLLAEIPGAQPTGESHAWVNIDDGKVSPEDVAVHFRFPGCTVGTATYRLIRREADEPSVWICAGDKDVFQAWKAAGYPAEMPETKGEAANAAFAEA
jgi:hypothetical protein